MNKPIIIVQGAQWGSEAKGMVTDALCRERDVDYAVRTGTVNAGHTVVDRGLTLKMQQIPCGFLNPRTILVIGPGAFIHPRILADEIISLRKLVDPNIMRRLYVDRRVNLHLDGHSMESTRSDRHHLIGATGKGCSAAVVDKIKNRNRGYMQFFPYIMSQMAEDLEDLNEDQLRVLRELNPLNDTEHLLNSEYDRGKQILIEGTQGTHLDLHLGPYPYTTHKQTSAAQWITECGLSPNLEYEIALVARTFPIRVAGNSGPMPLEMDWVTVANIINEKMFKAAKSTLIDPDAIKQFNQARKEVAYGGKYKMPLTDAGYPNSAFHTWNSSQRYQFRQALSEVDKEALELLPGPVVEELKKLFEMTTVTKKLRRIAAWDAETVLVAIRQNRPAYIVLTFLNYMFPQFWGETDTGKVMGDQHVRNYILNLSRDLGVPVRYTTTGPEAKHFLSTDKGIREFGQKMETAIAKRAVGAAAGK